jgi:hypothetical protein
MWQMIKDLLVNAKDSLGVEIPGLPDLGGVTETVTGAAEAVSGQAAEAASAATDVLGNAASDVSGAVGDAAAEAGVPAPGR